MVSLTFCIMTCGELTERDSRNSLGWSDSLFVIDEVRNVYPAAVALNQMIDQCKTEFLVPLDADMILKEGFLKRIEKAIEDNPETDWHSILFPLWDTLTQEKIMALKVFRTSIVKEIRYRDEVCPDIRHYKDLTEAGYRAINLMDQEPIGDHVVKGCFFCYAKYRDLYMVARTNPKTVLESHFKGGSDLLSRANSHFEFFTDRHRQTRNPDYLYCIAGMVAGLTEPLDYSSKNLGNAEMKVHVEDAKLRFRQWSGRRKRVIL